MFVILALCLALPQDYVNLVLEGQYEDAIGYCESMINKNKNPYLWKLEMGDIYYNRLLDFEKASQIYSDVVENHKDKDGWAHYRLAQVLEMREDYLNAARMYEIVATRFRKEPLDSFSLSGVERCFKKNYQDYVAVVDGYNITRLELDERTGRGTQMARSDERAVLEQMITERLIYASALKYDVTATDFFKKDFTARDRLARLDEARACEVMKRSAPTAKALKKYYKENKEKFKVSEQVMGKEIVVKSESLAVVILDSLKKDIASFDTLAKLHSVEASNRGGGNMGIVHPGKKPANVDSIIFKAEPNTLTDVIPFDEKFGIYYVTAHNPERYRDFDEVAKQIENQVRTENMTREEAALSARLLKKAKTKVYDDSIMVAVKGETDEVKDVTLAEVNGRRITWGDVMYRNDVMTPQFAKVDINNTESVRELIKTIFDEALKLELIWRNKYFLNDGYFIQMKEAFKAVLDQGLYQKVVIDAIVIDSAAVEQQYKETIEEYKVPESARVHEILFDSKETADKVYKEVLANPEAFDSLAMVYSTAPSSLHGGETGLIRRGMMNADYDNELFRLKVGQISGVFKVKESTWTIIKMAEYYPERYRTLDEVRHIIEARIKRQQQGTLASQFLEKMRQEADIKILLGEPEQSTENPSGDEE